MARWCRRGAAGLLLLAVLLGGGGSAQAEDAPTHGEVCSLLLTDLLAPLLGRLEEAGLSGIQLAERSAGSGDAALEQAMNDWFHERGVEVWYVGEVEPRAPEHVARLEYALNEVALELPDLQAEFLGLGPERVRRVARLGLSATLSARGSGEWLWRGSPEVRYEDWVRLPELERLAEDLPEWMPRPARPGSGEPKGTSWHERLTVVALMGGVAILYFSGAN